MNEQRPLIGVGVIIVRDARVLVGRRVSSHGAGTWSFPGGHLEYGEAPEQCAIREAAEETGLSVLNPRFATLASNVFEKDGKHYVTLYYFADCPLGGPEVMEPNKMVDWRWVKWEEIPRPRFPPLQSIIDAGFQLK